MLAISPGSSLLKLLSPPLLSIPSVSDDRLCRRKIPNAPIRTVGVFDPIDYEYFGFKFVQKLKNIYDPVETLIPSGTLAPSEYPSHKPTHSRNNFCLRIDISDRNFDPYALIGFDREVIFHEYMMNKCRPYGKKFGINIYFRWGTFCEDQWIVESNVAKAPRTLLPVELEQNPVPFATYATEESVLEALVMFLQAKIKVDLISTHTYDNF